MKKHDLKNLLLSIISDHSHYRETEDDDYAQGLMDGEAQLASDILKEMFNIDATTRSD